MISPEFLRRYPFFGGLTEAQLSGIALIADEVGFTKGTVIGEGGRPSTKFYLLTEGSVDLLYSGGGEGRISNALVGEVAPTYFASAQARERIAKTIPHAKVVCIFRDPVERVVSLYRMKRAYGMIPWSFEEAITRDSELLESSKYGANLPFWADYIQPRPTAQTTAVTAKSNIDYVL